MEAAEAGEDEGGGKFPEELEDIKGGFPDEEGIGAKEDADGKPAVIYILYNNICEWIIILRNCVFRAYHLL